jgi:serine/threonine protein kinase
LVLELIDGGQILDSKCNKCEELSPLFYIPGTNGVYEETIASVIFRQLLSALVYLQRNHIAHRDLKPENVLITKKGVVKLTDFGVSSDFSAANTEEGQKGLISDTKGTWPFWAPEMCDDSVEDGTKFCAYTADVWAAGVILYTMMMGTLPFWHVEPDSLFELISQTKTVELTPPYPEGISPDYCELLMAMLSPDPLTRPSFETCESFDWLQKQSNSENEKKLTEASSALIDREHVDKELVFTPGNSYFLVDDDDNPTGSFYKKSPDSNEQNKDKVSSTSDADQQKHTKVKEPPADLNGHEWHSKFLSKPTWCKICKSFVWGLTVEQQGAYKCKHCKTFGHRHCCVKLNESECQVAHQHGHIATSVTAELEDSNGHVWHAKQINIPRWCEVCQSFIYVANEHEQYAYKCAHCKTVGHKDCCLQRNQHPCPTKGEKGRAPLRNRLSFVSLLGTPKKDSGDSCSPSISSPLDSSDVMSVIEQPSESHSAAAPSVEETPSSPKKRSFGSGVLRRLSFVGNMKSAQKTPVAEKVDDEDNDKSSI